MVKEITSAEDFKAKVKSAAGVVLVDYHATWCGPCKMIAPHIEEMSKKYPNIAVYKVDVDEVDEVAASEGIQAMPTFIVYKAGNKVEELKGANKEKLEELFKKYN